MKLFSFYMLMCRDASIYTGHTDDLPRRIAQHGIGFFPHCYTADRRPLTMIWSEAFASRVEALAAERQLKGWSRAKKLALADGDWALVSSLARSGSGR